MKKILITGGSGFLGCRAEKFLSENFQVSAPSHSRFDITDEFSVLQFFDSFRPDILLHCAAVSGTADCQNDPVSSGKINVDGSRNLAEAADLYHTKVIFCSSDQVYSSSDRMMPHCETEILSPERVYAAQKLEAEKIFLGMSSENVILRLSWLFDMPPARAHEHGTFADRLLSVLSDHKHLELAVNDRRCITDVNDVVSGLPKVFALSGGIYNYGSGCSESFYNTVKTAFILSDTDSELLCRNTKDFHDRPRNLCMNTDKLNRCGIVFPSSAEALADLIVRIRKSL